MNAQISVPATNSPALLLHKLWRLPKTLAQCWSQCGSGEVATRRKLIIALVLRYIHLITNIYRHTVSCACFHISGLTSVIGLRCLIVRIPLKRLSWYLCNSFTYKVHTMANSTLEHGASKCWILNTLDTVVQTPPLDLFPQRQLSRLNYVTFRYVFYLHELVFSSFGKRLWFS